ncbi:ABC transporter substrate-binding protein [Paenibacillus radicis (ex Xue et al. 2023)]|uniref:Iron-siderophore ABC transporter substrate-binding protein n=1 Tax=Paenibacillus radicis (ex Xue et al. 2023) TaxID=2972489 RepID=A0ABT1YKG6_9BACL|nr:iron-siderophore ABC transporter substrate-binding protein [Paenibacillus radicis (ex Xue et al. 2023)]MCR8633685.1 iron-siderophore ABC transporter substrate-binding protein [Paenibacillus radicis (ex Xue et al. 2023)]
MKQPILKFRLKPAALMAIVMMLSVWLVACGAKQAEPQGAAPAKGGEVAKAEGPRKIKHAMGETEVPANPQRVIILTNEGTETVLALGVKPVGAVDSPYGSPWFDHIKKELDGVKPLGGESQPNLEVIAALKPDLILGNKMRQEKVYAQLSAIAPTVFAETLRGEWKSNFALFADALNKKAEGDKVVAAYDKRIEDFKKKAGDQLKDKVAVVRFMGGKTRFYYGDMFTGAIFKQIGMPRSDPKSDEKAFEDITKERLPELEAADRVFYFTYENGDGKATKQEQEWLNDPLWKNLKVVKNNKTFQVSDATWNTGGGVKSANLMLDDMYKIYGVTP